MRNRVRRGNSLCVSLLVVVSVYLCCSGCSDSGSSRPTASDFAPREISTTEREKLHEAEQLLIQKCMERYGFKTWPTPASSSLPDGFDFPYVITDEKWARRHGYGSEVYEGIALSRQRDPNQRYFSKLSPERRAAALVALNGPEPTGLSVRIPTGGVLRRSDQSCISEAESTLYGDLRTWYRVKKVTESLSSLRTSRTLKDERFKAATRPWALCMREHGHPYATPEEARSAALRGADGREGRAKEVRIAITEARCATESGLGDTAHRLDQQYKAAIEKQYSSEFKTKCEMESEALPRAAEIITGK